MPQSYPLSAINFVIKGGQVGNDSFPFRVLCTRAGYIPVIKLERLGVQIGL